LNLVEDLVGVGVGGGLGVRVRYLSLFLYHVVPKLAVAAPCAEHPFLLCHLNLGAGKGWRLADAS
jgi:hypothetical protein